MRSERWIWLRAKAAELVLAVPVRWKIAGIMILPVLILGFSLNYWIRTGLSDWLSYLLTDHRVQVAMQAGSRSVLFVTGLAAVASVLLTFLLMLLLTKPLLELREVAERVAGGDLTSRARVWARDEIGEVARTVNVMIDRLVNNRNELEATNRRLAAVNRVAAAAGRELGLQEVLDVSLKTTLEVMGLESGWIFLLDQEGAQFSLSTVVGLPPELEARLRNTRGTLCECQRAVLAGDCPLDVITTGCLRLRGEPPAAPLRHITIPLVARGHRFGVINLACPAVAQEESAAGPLATDHELLVTIGAVVSEAVANAWLHASLREKEAARQALLNALVRAQEDERARLARELHDGAGQVLTSLLVRLKMAEDAAPDHLRARLGELCESVSETIGQIRDLSYRLRPTVLDELGLEVGLRTLVAEMAEKAGWDATCRVQLANRRLPFEIETALYRIAQEALTNALRHAAAKTVTVELVQLPYAVCLRVEDDGRGFEPEALVSEEGQRRLGLIGMQERAEMLDGSIVFYSGPGAGTSVQVRIPLEMEVA